MLPDSRHADGGPGPAPADAARELGEALRNHRLARGLSLRAFARQAGLSAHSGLSDYERGLRVPPEDVVTSYERICGQPPGTFSELRARAYAERMRRRMNTRPPAALSAWEITPAEDGPGVSPALSLDLTPAPAALSPASPRTRPGVARLLARPRAALVAGALAVVLVTVVVTLGARDILAGQVPRPAVSPTASALSPAAVNLGPGGREEPVREHASAWLLAGYGIDLDAAPPYWSAQQGPPGGPWDLELTTVGSRLVAIGGASLALVPPAIPGTRLTCGSLRDYWTVLASAQIRAGVQLCVRTSGHRYALLLISGVSYVSLQESSAGNSATEVPGAVIFGVTVWNPTDAP